jgi:glycerate dehydrogenase
VHERTSPASIVERAREAEIVVTNKAPLSAATLAQLPALQFIAVTATGYNIVDIDAARQRGIPVSNVPIYGTDSVAQATFALLLELTNHVGAHDRAVKDGGWCRSPEWCFWNTPLIELAGKKLGIIGYGRIGRRVGEIGKAFGMELLPADIGLGDIPTVFREADVVTLHCPQTVENAGLVNRELLALMKPTAFFINTARGGLMVEQDLAEALNAGRIAGAAVDVVSAEPMKPDNPLLRAKNCLITPHISWATLEARRRLMETTAENVRAFLAGKPINVVNG